MRQCSGTRGEIHTEATLSAFNPGTIDFMLSQFSADYWRAALRPVPLIEPVALIEPRALIKAASLTPVG